ncbi:MAG: TonB-dependent siderophore receptor [Aquabacterium sp.]|jgi:TonB-dependent siderophore receptor|uniref:TonB-dependent siderophore receptor n=1 Tax=Aquabacterium sp. TaxID=1872578 RepID=UPI003BAE8E6C
MRDHPCRPPFLRRPLTLSLVLALGAPAAAWAQAAATPAAASNEQEAGALPSVSVRAARVRDASTEDSGYVARSATVGKEARSLRELPNSVTVITRQELDDRNVHTIEDALKNVTGVTIQRFDAAGNYSQFMARGFAADAYQLDGLTLQTDANGIYFDLAGYDRVEVQRGMASLFSGAGEPGITVNIARKRALVTPKTEVGLSAGTWDAYRADLDVNRALNAAGTLRGRMVAAYEDRGTFMDGIGSRKKFIYGTVEADIAERTTLSVGTTWQDVNTVLSRGLPTWDGGKLIDMRRSTMPVQSWNAQRLTSTSHFAEIEHRGLDDSTLKFALRRVERGNDARYIDPSIPSANGTMAGFPIAGNATPGLSASAFEREDSDSTADAYYSQPFELGGQKHNFMVGVDYRVSRATTRFAAYAAVPGTSLNLFDVDLDAIPQPNFVLGAPQKTRVTSSGLYSQLRIKPTTPLTLIAGARVNSWKSESTSTTGARTSYSENGHLTPYLAAIVDVTPTTSIYASYNEIFKPQADKTITGEQLKPRTGKQYEVGVKGEFNGGRLTWQADVYHLTDENRAVAIDNTPNAFTSLGKVEIKGFEGELRGELTSQWSFTGGYAYTQTTYLSGSSGQAGTSFSPVTPKHNVNLSTRYKLNSVASGLEVGGGVRLSSKFYNVPLVRGPGYGIAFLSAAYPLSSTYKVTLNVDNLFDKDYYEKVSGTTRQNFFGAPRSITVALRGSF